MRRWITGLAVVALVLMAATGWVSGGSSSPFLPDAPPCPSVTPTTVPGHLPPACLGGFLIRDGQGNLYLPPSTPYQPVAYPTCTGSLPDGCWAFDPQGTPIYLPGPPTVGALAVPTCEPSQRDGCTLTPSGALREHWTATAEARP